MQTKHAVLIFALSVFSAPAAAADLSSTSTSSSAWSATSHLGFAVVDRSTTGFEKGTGSLVFCDLERDLKLPGPGLSLGLRTVAQGAKLEGRSFYRLGTGPLVTARVSTNWLVQIAATRFDETGLGEDDETHYRSRGGAAQIGWERIFHFGPKVEFAWGGFVGVHQGDLAVTPAATGMTTGSTRNAGMTHGVEAALRVDL